MVTYGNVIVTCGACKKQKDYFTIFFVMRINGFMVSLGNRIRLARERAGYTQEKVAERIGVSRSAVSRWEQGEIEPKVQNLVAIAALLSVSTDYLLGIGDHETPGSLRLSEEAESALHKFIIEVRKDN